MDKAKQFSCTRDSRTCYDDCPNLFLQSYDEDTPLEEGCITCIECPRLDCCRLTIKTLDGTFQFVPFRVRRSAKEHLQNLWVSVGRALGMRSETRKGHEKHAKSSLTTED